MPLPSAKSACVVGFPVVCPPKASRIAEVRSVGAAEVRQRQKVSGGGRSLDSSWRARNSSRTWEIRPVGCRRDGGSGILGVALRCPLVQSSLLGAMAAALPLRAGTPGGRPGLHRLVQGLNLCTRDKKRRPQRYGPDRFRRGRGAGVAFDPARQPRARPNHSVVIAAELSAPATAVLQLNR